MSEEVSVQQSLFKESERIEMIEAYQKTHKTAFRMAFNFLDEHFPPVDTEEYWTKTCNDAAYLYATHDTNKLFRTFLADILIYLSDLKKHNSESL